jgi:hypothetical protein
MGKVLVSAAAGVAAAAVVLAAFALGLRISPELLMMIAAALSVGAAVSVVTRHVVDAPAGKTDREKFLSRHLRDVKDLIDLFPRGGVRHVIRSDTSLDNLDIAKNPASYQSEDILVVIKEGPKGFNPIVLRQIFEALQQRPNFLHLLLRSKEDDFVGYIPGHVAKREFTGSNAEARIAEYIVNVLEDAAGNDKDADGERRYANSANLSKIGGLGRTDTISDEATLSHALDRMEAGFLRLVVLRGGHHRKPVGLLHSEKLVPATKGE